MGTIIYKELLSGNSIADVPIKHQQNLDELLKAMQVVREEFGKPMIVTSGYRTEQQHLRIYSAKGITDRRLIPMQSAHLVGLACDISDPNGDLNAWCLQNNELLSILGLYMEERQGPWQHFQLRRPASGNRWFKP